MGSHGDVGISVGTEGVALRAPSRTPASAGRRGGPAAGWDPGWGGHLASLPRARGSSSLLESGPRAGMEQTCPLSALSVPLRL